MKICILTSGHEPTDGRVFIKEVQSLLKNGFNDITIIAPYHKDYDEIDGVKIIGFRKRKSNSIKDRFRPLLDLYKKALNCKADIYHCHEPDTLAIGAYLKRKYGSKLIYDSHEYHPEHFAERYKGLKGKILCKIIYKFEKYLARKTDYVLTVNEELVKKFKDWGCKGVFLPNYAVIKDNLYIKDNPIIRSLKDKGFLIGIFAGGMYKQRGIIELILANKILKEKGFKIAMVFMGWCHGNFVEKTIDFVKQNDLDDRVIFIGKKEHSYVLNMMAQSDFGMLNNYPKERFLKAYAVKLYEYMQCSLPIYASNLPSHIELLNEGNCGIVEDPLNPEDIAESLIRLCSDKNNMKLMGINGNKLFIRKYNWSVVEGQFIDCYRKLGDR